jgi:hypothetical protein
MSTAEKPSPEPFVPHSILMGTVAVVLTRVAVVEINIISSDPAETSVAPMLVGAFLTR